MLRTEGQPTRLGFLPTLRKLLPGRGKRELPQNQGNRTNLEYQTAHHNLFTALEPYEGQMNALPLNQKRILREKTASYTPSSNVVTTVTAEQTEEGLVIILDEKSSAVIPVPFLSFDSSAGVFGSIVCDQYFNIFVLGHNISRIIFFRDRYKPMAIARGCKTTYLPLNDTSGWTEDRLAIPQPIINQKTIIDVFNSFCSGLK